MAAVLLPQAPRGNKPLLTNEFFLNVPDLQVFECWNENATWLWESAATSSTRSACPHPLFQPILRGVIWAGLGSRPRSAGLCSQPSSPCSRCCAAQTPSVSLSLPFSSKRVRHRFVFESSRPAVQQERVRYWDYPSCSCLCNGLSSRVNENWAPATSRFWKQISTLPKRHKSKSPSSCTPAHSLWCLWKLECCHLKTKVLSWQERLHKESNGSCHICTVWTPSVSQVYSETKKIPSSPPAIYQKIA